MRWKFMKIKRHKFIRLTLIILFLSAFLFVFLSHRLTAEQVEEMLGRVNHTELMNEISSLHENGVLKNIAHQPLPKTLQNLGVKRIHMNQGRFHAVLDEFFVSETGFMVAKDSLKTCKDFPSPYCRKISDRIFYYHIPG